MRGTCHHLLLGDCHCNCELPTGQSRCGSTCGVLNGVLDSGSGVIKKIVRRSCPGVQSERTRLQLLLRPITIAIVHDEPRAVLWTEPFGT